MLNISFQKRQLQEKLLLTAAILIWSREYGSLVNRALSHVNTVHLINLNVATLISDM